MNYLLVYKGHYKKTLAGPEVRNLGIARSLLNSGHSVCLAGKSTQPGILPRGCEFIEINHLVNLFKALLAADVIILHGGGPVLLLLVLLAGLRGRHLVLDAYVPHWIELELENPQGSLKSVFKKHLMACFNIWRKLFGVMVFNQLIVANLRQQDVVRGIMAPFFLTQEFQRVSVIPFGCDECFPSDKRLGKNRLLELSSGKLQPDDFLIGWLGGIYGWFDINEVIKSVQPAFESDSTMKLVFFGIAQEQQSTLLHGLSTRIQQQIVFLPWVDFNQRFNYWCGLDLALVWGSAGYENDYASRTRNFDCLTLGLPVLQNPDDEWGLRLVTSGAGVVTCIAEMSNTLSALSREPQRLTNMGKAMRDLAPEFYWSAFVDKLTKKMKITSMSLPRRLLGLCVFILTLPALMLAGITIGALKLKERR